MGCKCAKFYNVFFGYIMWLGVFFTFCMISSSGFEAQCVFLKQHSDRGVVVFPKVHGFEQVWLWPFVCHFVSLLAHLFVFLWYMPTFATNVEAVCVKLTSLHATSSERKTASVYPPLIWHVAQITERTRETLDLFFGSRISHRRRQTFQSNTRGAGRVPAEPKQLQKQDFISRLRGQVPVSFRSRTCLKS